LKAGPPRNATVKSGPTFPDPYASKANSIRLHRQQMCGLQLGADVQSRIWGGGATQLLSDLGRCISPNSRNRAEPASHSANSSAMCPPGMPSKR
jgi:hypothetical protein